MKNIHSSIKLLLLILLLSLITSCSKDPISPKQNVPENVFGIFTALNDTTAEMNGDIDGRTPRYFNELIGSFPNIKRINMLDCPGSVNDDANLRVSKEMHDYGIHFHLFSTSVIASGAVDMYVGGVKRTRDPGGKIGVHSWGNEPGEPIATSYPVGHDVHLPYIDYYISVGFTQEEAEDFYYFTINAAPAEGIHWMTDAEIIQYKVTKP